MSATHARQILASPSAGLPQVGLSQQEEIVELPLFAPGRVALVLLQLAVAQAFESFALAACLLKDFLLLVAQILPTHEFALGVLALLAQPGFAGESKAQLSGGRAGLQLLRLARLNLPDPVVDVIDEMARFGDLLIRRAQAQLLLMFYALPEMKDGLQGKMKGHIRCRYIFVVTRYSLNV
jgi:hypothetical protein